MGITGLHMAPLTVYAGDDEHTARRCAIAAGGVEVLSEDLIRDRDIPYACVQQVAVRERLELERHDRLFCGDRPPPIIRDCTVILIDDGLATGLTMQAAILALRQQAPHRRCGAGRCT